MPGVKPAARRAVSTRRGRPDASAASASAAPARKPAAAQAGPASATPVALPAVTTASEAAAAAGRETHGTAIGRCVSEELARYFEVLDGEPPVELYRAVMRQAEAALLRSVLEQCRGNQSRAATWLGISRGTLRGKLIDLGIR